MYQEIGETRDALIEDDNIVIKKIIDANKSRRDLYWIVMFVKPSKSCVNGLPTLDKFIKPYHKKPAQQVGMIIGEVDNKKGSLKWDVNQPQRPFDFDALRLLGADPCDEVVTETTTIPGAYVTR